MAFKDSQFDYLFSAIASKFPGIQQEGTTQFQFTGAPMAANWKTGTDYEAYQFANHVSADVNGFYTPNPGQLTNAYASLITSIDPGVDVSKDPTYVKFMKQKQDIEADYVAAVNEMKAAWATYKASNTNSGTGLPDESKSDWEKDVLGGLSYMQSVTEKNNALLDITQRIATLETTFDAALKQDILNLTDKKYQAQYVRNGTPISLPEITIEGNLGQDVTNWDSMPEGQYDLDVTLDKDSIVKTPWKTVTRTNISQHCLHTSVSTSVNRTRLIEDEHYKLRVMIKGFRSYDITYGGWYDPSYVNPNTAKFSPAATVNKDTFFSKASGSLHMIPSQVWVMYQPEIELTISTDLYKETIQAAMSSNINWLDLFSIRFSASAGHSIVHEGETVTTIRFNSPTVQGPQVYGVTSLVEVV